MDTANIIEELSQQRDRVVSAIEALTAGRMQRGHSLIAQRGQMSEADSKRHKVSLFHFGRFTEARPPHGSYATLQNVMPGYVILVRRLPMVGECGAVPAYERGVVLIESLERTQGNANAGSLFGLRFRDLSPALRIPTF
jgi:hypothetical protein